MDFRRLRSLKNSKFFSRFLAAFLSVALVTVTCLVYDMVLYAMETAQSEAVTDNQAANVPENDTAAADLSGSILSVEDLQEFSLCNTFSPAKEITPMSALTKTLPTDDPEAIAIANATVISTEAATATEDVPVTTADAHQSIDEEIAGITYKTVVEKEVLPCSYTEVALVYSAWSGKYDNITAHDGEKEVTKRQKYINGELVDEVVVSEKITVNPVDGVKYVDRRDLLDTSAAPSSYVAEHRIKFTAYTYGEVGGSYTATGDKTRVGYVAVDRNLIPLHSLLYIVMDNGFVYGYAYAKDVGGGIKGNRIDLFLPSMEDMRDFGIKMGTCYVIREGK